jgi:transposase
MINNNEQSTTTSPRKSKGLCKLGLDTHAKTFMVSRQLEGMNPQPPQRFAPDKLLGWVAKLVAEGYEVISCYEAGPTGYWLHRELQRLGATNYVVCPTRLDSRGKGVNTDKTDALELLVRLDRFVAGNKKAFSVVQVPSVEQERKRQLSRQRQQLRDKRLSFAAQGRMLLLSQGYRQSNSWWKKSQWEPLQESLPQWLVPRLAVWVRLIEGLNEEIKGLEKTIQEQAPKSLPLGMGQLTHEILDREVKDWKQFKNRRQIGSYSGLTGGVSSSGEQHADLSVTKAGNRRLSSCLVECAWRLLLKQPKYWLVKKWGAVLLNPKVHTRRRKQAIVAFARQLLVDIWKWKTGKTTPEQLGWAMTSY